MVAREACFSAHLLGRQVAAQGHKVRLMSPEYVRPYVKARKNDDRDAEAIACSVQLSFSGRPRLISIWSSMPRGKPLQPMERAGQSGAGSDPRSAATLRRGSYRSMTRKTIPQTTAPATKGGPRPT